ncbi:ribosomal protein S18-alanine N-acetyltransferase [Desulfurispira natronophila]|uniref:[Ribosomal protein bS18]-alanine N-acetyltransferase n=1 Tax=Desulfurispira natronophila TaxID=682562 RepID=A0A7W8DG50_9BACT|nr:ribosomal protein S18-alanine N-acetyltransferase [Desulfurispira natronophila]MBB5021045.1 ribosomal-protein-alanine N-acetyltransferase [Desulfurispira natronophila]
MSDSLQVQLLSLNDLDGIERIERARFSHPWSRDQLESELQHPRILALGAHHHGSLLGYLFAYILPGEAQLNNVAVDPEFSRMGVATLLMNQLESAARAAECQKIVLEVNASNQGAIALYCQCGYQQLGKRKKYYRDGGDALLMEKILG